MTPTGPALLAAILAAPDEDTPRLVYADWLEENGEGARAEFIRVQVEIAQQRAGKFQASPENDRRQNWLQRREWDLLATHWREWFKRPGNVDIPDLDDWSRGFVSRLRCPWPDWRDHAAAILAAHPVRNVTLTTRPDPNYLLNLCFALTGVMLGFRRDEEISARIPDCLKAIWPRIEFGLPPIMGAVYFDEQDELECEQHMR